MIGSETRIVATDFFGRKNEWGITYTQGSVPETVFSGILLMPA
jgi:hypothetical protein